MDNNQPYRVVIIGAGYAGIITALRLAGRVTDHDKVRITLINGREHFVERIRLHQEASDQALKTHHIPKILHNKAIDFMQGWVTEIAPEAKTVTVKQGNTQSTHTYDTLVYALGSMVDRDGVPGVRDHAYTLDPHMIESLRGRLLEIASHGGTLTVCGGGLTGIEAATEFAECYPALKVQMVTRGLFGKGLSHKARAYLCKTFDNLNIAVSEHANITRINADSVVLDDGRTIAHEVVLWAGKFTVPTLARENGITVNAMGQIMVDPYLRAISHPEIYAVGDSAQFVDAPNAPIRMACATAMPMGTQAGENIARMIVGEPLQAFSFKYLVQCMSLGRKDGLIQWVNGDDRPRERITTGRLGVFIKEQICRFTIWMLHLERRYTGAYRWAGQGKPIESLSNEVNEVEEKRGIAHEHIS